MKYTFRPPRAAISASIQEYPDGCCTRPYQVINLRHAFVLGYMAGQKAMRKRRAQTVGGESGA